MHLLAIETSTMTGSIAVADEGRVISELTFNVRARYSEKLMAAMDYLLNLSGLTIDDVDGVAVSIGPGSFTGLRVGLSAAKGLCYASGKPLIGIPTLDALSLNIPLSSNLLCPILDARKGEVYTAIYRPDGQTMRKMTDDMAISPESLAEMIREKTVFIGDGVCTYGKLLRERLKDYYIEAPAPLLTPRASNVATLALKRLEKGDTDDPFKLVPRYLRKSEAELKWKGK